MAIESATTHFAALSAMQEGARAMKSLNNNMSIDDVDEVMDEIREQIEVANEVGQAIASPLGTFRLLINHLSLSPKHLYWD